ncbi:MULTISPECIES: metal-dependent hydrolase [Jeotgalicoccus]|uniref:metal-dependent hydrolase n=1 Tax=Jeotgalicoccus TaxID=227979 RepID=UPI001F0CF294|nr:MULTISPECIES: metal-dependent hydrolase [Jeotgalicoccus]
MQKLNGSGMMDTLTHTLMGGTIVGLAQIDPNIDPVSAGFITTVVGASLIPDIDTLMKLKNNAIYIKHHRGITHSLPFTVLIWPLLLAILSSTLFGLPFINMYFWSLFGVFLHVFSDIFNAYGTQALRPFNHTWIQLGYINTIDIPIIIMHALYFILWFVGFNPVMLFIILYGVLVLYYITRFTYQKYLIQKIIKQIPDRDISRVFCMPTIRFNEWRVVVISADYYYVGRTFKGQIVFYDRFEKVKPLEGELFEAVKDDENFKSFTFFSSIYRHEVKDIDHNTIEVRYIDLRYLKDGHYPFVCIMLLDKDDFDVQSSYTGWVFTENKLQQKLS